MRIIDVFNGDADGLCALQQLRLAQPEPDHLLVTGVKRDINLLEQVNARAGDKILALDISFDKNRAAVARLLGAGARIEYFDHHFAGDIPEHENLIIHIDTTADTCTSLIVDKHLHGKHRLWAVTGAFGDNLFTSARHCAEPLSLKTQELAALQELGTLLNYNGYGESIADLFFPPAELFRQLSPFASPFEFMKEYPAFKTLRDGYSEDMSLALDSKPAMLTATHAIYTFPAEAWARRVSGVYANTLAREAPQRAHALLTQLADKDGYQVSVRAPKLQPDGADSLCRQFPSGGGRKAAAGINFLPADQLDTFIAKFKEAF